MDEFAEAVGQLGVVVFVVGWVVGALSLYVGAVLWVEWFDWLGSRKK